MRPEVAARTAGPIWVLAALIASALAKPFVLDFGSDSPPMDCSGPGAVGRTLASFMDCHSFYQCYAVSEDELRPYRRSCGYLMFNPMTSTCDWPANVVFIRPECRKTFTIFSRIVSAASTHASQNEIEDGPAAPPVAAARVAGPTNNQKRKREKAAAPSTTTTASTVSATATTKATTTTTPTSTSSSSESLRTSSMRRSMGAKLPRRDDDGGDDRARGRRRDDEEEEEGPTFADILLDTFNEVEGDEGKTTTTIKTTTTTTTTTESPAYYDDETMGGMYDDYDEYYDLTAERNYEDDDSVASATEEEEAPYYDPFNPFEELPNPLVPQEPTGENEVVPTRKPVRTSPSLDAQIILDLFETEGNTTGTRRPATTLSTPFVLFDEVTNDDDDDDDEEDQYDELNDIISELANIGQGVGAAVATTASPAFGPAIGSVGDAVDRGQARVDSVRAIPAAPHDLQGSAVAIGDEAGTLVGRILSAAVGFLRNNPDVAPTIIKGVMEAAVKATSGGSIGETSVESLVSAGHDIVSIGREAFESSPVLTAFGSRAVEAAGRELERTNPTAKAVVEDQILAAIFSLATEYPEFFLRAKAVLEGKDDGRRYSQGAARPRSLDGGDVEERSNEEGQEQEELSTFFPLIDESTNELFVKPTTSTSSPQPPYDPFDRQDKSGNNSDMAKCISAFLACQNGDAGDEADCSERFRECSGSTLLLPDLFSHPL